MNVWQRFRSLHRGWQVVIVLVLLVFYPLLLILLPVVAFYGLKEKPKVHRFAGVIVALLPIVIFASMMSSDSGDTDDIRKQLDALDSQKHGTELLVEKTAKREATEPPAPPVTAPEHTLVYVASGKRYDGGSAYYALLTTPVDISTEEFKEGIRALVQSIVAERGRGISIELHDNRESLDLSYKQYGDQSLDRALTQGERDVLARHFIASFDGELDTGIYRNTLMFFPSAFRQHSVVGRYVASEEFNP